jgi:hypothetical protein
MVLHREAIAEPPKSYKASQLSNQSPGRPTIRGKHISGNSDSIDSLTKSLFIEQGAREGSGLVSQERRLLVGGTCKIDCILGLTIL